MLKFNPLQRQGHLLSLGRDNALKFLRAGGLKITRLLQNFELFICDLDPILGRRDVRLIADDQIPRRFQFPSRGRTGFIGPLAFIGTYSRVLKAACINRRRTQE